MQLNIVYTLPMFERCLYFNLNALTRRVNKIWGQAFEKFDLSPSHAYLLRAVLAEPGMTQQSIAKELKLEKSTITRFIEGLESKDLLVRVKSGREQQVYPTETAKRIQDKLEAQGNTLYQQMIDSLGKGSLLKLVDNLRSFNQRLK